MEKQLLKYLDSRFLSIDNQIKDLKNDVGSVRQDFNTFEAGRLTDLTSKVAVLEEQNKKEEDSVFKKLAYKVIEYIILAVVAGVMFLLIK